MAEMAFDSGKWAVQSDYGGGRSRLTQHSAPEVTRPHTKTIGACLYNVYIFDKVSLSLCLYLRFIQNERRNQPLRLQPPVASASASIHCALESSEASSLSADKLPPSVEYHHTATSNLYVHLRPISFWGKKRHQYWERKPNFKKIKTICS